MPTPSTSVVIPTLNEAHNLAPLLRKLGTVLDVADTEFVIVDDDSADGTADVASALERHYPSLVVHRRLKDHGLASAICFGITKARGRVVVVMDAENDTYVYYEHDLLNRLTAKDFDAAAAHVKGELTAKSFHYDALNRLTKAEDTDSRILYTYNTASLVETEEMQYGVTNVGDDIGRVVEFDYDVQGRLLALRYPDATATDGQLNYAYDGANRLTQIERQLSAQSTEPIVTWSLKGDRVTRKDYGNGTYAQATFNARRMLSNYVHAATAAPADEKIVEFDYAYDDAGRILGEAIRHFDNSGALVTDHGFSFVYDKADRLTKLYTNVPVSLLGDQAPATHGLEVAYSLDDQGNRVTVGTTPSGSSPSTDVYTTNETNAYTVVDWAGAGYTEYDFDKAGNRTWQTDTDRSWCYDYQNKLVEVKNGNDKYAEYDYDALGRRMAKRYLFDGLHFEEHRRYYFAGAALIQEYKVTLNDEEEIEVLETDYVWGLSLAEPIQIRRFDDPEIEEPEIHVAYYHQNLMGSVYALSGATGDILENYRYREYGSPTFYTGDTTTTPTTYFGNWLLWQASYYDIEVYNLESGLALYGAEPLGYDPELSSNLSRSIDDPTGVGATNQRSPVPVSTWSSVCPAIASELQSLVAEQPPNAVQVVIYIECEFPSPMDPRATPPPPDQPDSRRLAIPPVPRPPGTGRRTPLCESLSSLCGLVGGLGAVPPLGSPPEPSPDRYGTPNPMGRTCGYTEIGQHVKDDGYSPQANVSEAESDALARDMEYIADYWASQREAARIWEWMYGQDRYLAPIIAYNNYISDKISEQIRARQESFGYQFGPVIYFAVIVGMATPIKTPSVAASASRAGYATRRAVQIGRAGERAAGIVKNTQRIASATGTAAYRVPDVLNHSARVIGEVKNVASLSYTSQLRDFAAYAASNKYTFLLWVRPTTRLSGRLQQAVANGEIVLRFLR